MQNDSQFKYLPYSLPGSFNFFITYSVIFNPLTARFLWQLRYDLKLTTLFVERGPYKF